MEVHVGTLKGMQTRYNFEYVAVGVEYPFYVSGCFIILDFIVHVEYAKFAGYVVPAHVIYAQIEQHTAVLSSGKRYVYIVEFREYGTEAFLCQLIDVLSYCRHCISF